MIYKGDYTREISFPIGGIGTGCFGIAGNGRFIDWEIFNKPAKGSILDFSHIAVKAKRADASTVVKVLNGDETKDLTGRYSKTIYRGFGYGPETGTMCAIPHFKNFSFDGEFPIAKISFSDKDFPAEVVLTVFNPFIPLDSKNSSIPAGFFNIEFLNTTDEDIEYTAVFSMKNPFENTINTQIDNERYTMLKLSTDIDKEDISYGDITVATDSCDTDIQQYWYRGTWNDNLDVFISELLNNDRLKNRAYTEKGNGDVGSVAAHTRIKAKNSGNIRFVSSWNVPNNYNYWDENNKGKKWKNYYATVFDSSVESAKYCIDHFEELFERTMDFKNALFDSSINNTVIEAISATMSVLKSPTVLRLEDGSFYGWEGVHENAGSCEGTCQHVWNYAYALCFLFPELERSLRNNEFTYCTAETGRTVFRMPLPRDGVRNDFRACVDGQMGTIIKTYREWKISGDSEWLKSVWPTVKKILSYAWSEDNADRWDIDKDGILEGRQHHTLDVELFGPNAWLQGFYMCALKAAEEMAEFFGEKDLAKEYADLFEKGYKWTRDNLFNGEYFIQKIDLSDKSVTDAFNCSDYYWYNEKKELKYQIADGCEINQLCGQWHASICGLGYMFEKDQIKTALDSLYKYNFKESMRDNINTWRVFSLNDEGGAIICEYPDNVKRPVIPIPYHRETMTGFEYALAGLMISEGMEEKGLTIVNAIRDRYDGKKRNPWNEIECGSNYARAMASFALLPIYSGFVFDLPNNMIGFDPIHKDNFKCMFSVGTAWGTFEWTNNEISVIIKEGNLKLDKFFVKADIKELIIDGVKTEFGYENDILHFDCVNICKDIVLKL